MRQPRQPRLTSLWVVCVTALGLSGLALAADPPPSSYMPVVITETFQAIKSRMEGAKRGVMQRHRSLLEQRYDLSNRPVAGLTMTRGKPVQGGVRARLPSGVTWEELGTMTPEQIRERNAFPIGFLPLPHPNHPEGGMVFPQFQIDELKRLEQRDLTRFDLDFDLPDHFVPEFPAPIFLTTRPDLGDVSKGKVVNINNYSNCSTASSIRNSWKDCACWSPRSRSNSSTRPRTAAPRCPVAAWRAWIATATATPRRPRTWWATSGRSSSVIASTRRRCAA
jgi:cytochrome c peroxidase